MDSPRRKLSYIERWQTQLLPLMRAALVLMALFFFLASLYQYQKLYSDIKAVTPSIMKELNRLEQSLANDQLKNTDYIRWRTMLALEQDVVHRRYQQINTTLLLRTWTRYTGFLVGMVLALTGAFFILGKLKEGESQLSGEGSGVKFALTTSSPGIILATLGTFLMAITLIVKFDFDVIDKPVYILPYGLTNLNLNAKPAEISEGNTLQPLPGPDDFPKPPGS